MLQASEETHFGIAFYELWFLKSLRIIELRKAEAS